MNLAGAPTKIPEPWAVSAAPGNVLPVPLNDPGDGLGKPSFQLGYPPVNFIAVGAGGIPPWGQYTNGIFNQLSAGLQWSQAGGPSYYDSGFSAAIGGYPSGAAVPAAGTQGLWWYSTADNNTTDPDTGGAGWVSSLQLSDYLEDTGTGNHIVITPPVTLSGVLKGQRFSIRVANNNTGATDIKIGSLAAVALKTQAGTDPVANDLIAGDVIQVVATSTSSFQWIAAQPVTSYISARTHRSTLLGNMQIPIWNPNTGANEMTTIADLASYIGNAGILLPFFLGGAQ